MSGFSIPRATQGHVIARGNVETEENGESPTVTTYIQLSEIYEKISDQGRLEGGFPRATDDEIIDSINNFSSSLNTIGIDLSALANLSHEDGNPEDFLCDIIKFIHHTKFSASNKQKMPHAEIIISEILRNISQNTTDAEKVKTFHSKLLKNLIESTPIFLVRELDKDESITSSAVAKIVEQHISFIVAFLHEDQDLNLLLEDINKVEDNPGKQVEKTFILDILIFYSLILEELTKQPETPAAEVGIKNIQTSIENLFLFLFKNGFNPNTEIKAYGKTYKIIDYIREMSSDLSEDFGFNIGATLVLTAHEKYLKYQADTNILIQAYATNVTDLNKLISQYVCIP